MADKKTPDPRQLESRSAPSGENRFGFYHFFGRAGEVNFVFSSLARNKNFNGVKFIMIHAEAELFVDLAESVLFEAFAHVGASGSGDHIAT